MVVAPYTILATSYIRFHPAYYYQLMYKDFIYITRVYIFFLSILHLLS